MECELKNYLIMTATLKMYTIISTVLILALLGSCYAEEKVSYSGYSLYRATPQKSSQIAQLRSLMHDEAKDGIEFWREPNRPHESVDIMVSPESHDFLVTKLRVMRIPNELIMYDVGDVIHRTSKTEAPHLKHTFRDMTNTSFFPTGYLKPAEFYTKYHRYGDIEAKLQELAKDPKVTLEVAGSSFENRNLYLVKISTDPSANKPVIFIDGGHHAREWVSHSTLLYIMESLLNDNMPVVSNSARLRPKMARNDNNSDADYDDDSLCSADSESTTINYRDGAAAPTTFDVPSLKAHLDEYDFWFLPVINPDGYEYTHTHNRLWRKTRSHRKGQSCRGTDPNRNYPEYWSHIGTSPYPCDETFAGPKALSEPETETLANLLTTNQGRIVMYITLHAYSQVILTPYGHARVYPPNYNEMQRIARVGMNALAKVRGTAYRFGTSAILLYPASGGSDDFAYTKANIKISFTIELPDTGYHGFLMPPEEIIPIGQETTVGLSAMVGALKQ